MTRRNVLNSVALFLVVAGYFLLANDSRHHWHEFRYLHSATHYSTTELMRGVFDPGPSPASQLQEVVVWYATELFHVYFLRQLVHLLGIGLTSYIAIKLLYGVLLLLAAELFRRTLQNLGMATSRAALVAAVFLFSPVTLYLGFKLMGEVPSFFLAACALFLFTLGLRQPRAHTILYYIGAGIALVLSMLASARMPVLFFGFWVALMYAWMPKISRKRVLLAGLVTSTVLVATLPVTVWFLGGSIHIYYSALISFMGFTKKLPVWMFAVFNLGLVGMGLWLFLPLAWFSSDHRSRRFFLLWLLFSAIPVMVTTVNFMEPRYLITGIIPFVGLAALGIEALWDRMQRWRLPFRAALATLLMLLMLGGSTVAQTVMPYETDAKRLIEAVRSETKDNSTVILVPWNYTDFHLLRFVFPEKPIYLVQSAVSAGGVPTEDPVWTARRISAYGTHFLPNAEALPKEFRERRIIFIGWTILPSLQNLRSFLAFTKSDRVAGYLDDSRFLNHMTQTWLWQSQHLRMREVAQFGQYRVFQVHVD